VRGTLTLNVILICHQPCSWTLVQHSEDSHHLSVVLYYLSEENDCRLSWIKVGLGRQDDVPQDLSTHSGSFVRRLRLTSGTILPGHLRAVFLRHQQQHFLLKSQKRARSVASKLRQSALQGQRLPGCSGQAFMPATHYFYSPG